MAKLESVFSGGSSGLAGEAKLVENRVHEVAGAVSCEGTACAVGSMSAGSEAKDEHTGLWISKAGNRAGPIGLVLIGATPGFADAAAIVAKTGAALAIDDGFADLL